MTDQQVDASGKPRRPTREYEKRQARVRFANPKGQIPKGLEMFPLPTGVIAALCQAPVPSSLVKIGPSSARMTRWVWFVLFLVVGFFFFFFFFFFMVPFPPFHLGKAKQTHNNL
ncbi:hypothetical protein PpBr36_01655 [Pyricularia pennisetigena]|uniref:hypothetical protein n=1 Tax=Pyricularia pennisetigena TaxID=1578925 RepID=UPI0011538627|nr:hypothetical protein PpBr36_01655 [Pyricularia pennisetigena]TLS29095.1 hypothetical protein PpBr36_01655 [Pyricularia pennisetigena]